MIRKIMQEHLNEEYIGLVNQIIGTFMLLYLIILYYVSFLFISFHDNHDIVDLFQASFHSKFFSILVQKIVLLYRPLD